MDSIYGTKKISKLKRIDEAQGSDLLSVSAKTDDAYESVRMSIDTITDATMSYEYDGLNTDAKTIVGAINEAKAEHTSVVVEQLVSTGEHIADISVGEETTEIYSQTIQANVDSEPVSQLNKIKIDNTVYSIPTTETVIYGFHIDSSESDPSACVTYLMDSVNKTPAHMNYSTDTFDYGDWADTFIIKGIKPCILNPQGQVVCYLNPNDYTKDIDGNTVPITQAEMDADSTSPYYHCNIMIEFPKIWYKIVPDNNDNTSASIYISNVKADDDYKDWAYIKPDGVTHAEHFYIGAYRCSGNSNLVRSVSGAEVFSGATASEYLTYCNSVGTGWSFVQFSQRLLINFLLTLISKSLNSQEKFGNGAVTGGSSTVSTYFRTGVHDKKGMFYGKNTGAITQDDWSACVKVFGLENYWGYSFDSMLGYVVYGTNNETLLKMCYGTSDGSTETLYHVSGIGYVSIPTKVDNIGASFLSKQIYVKDLGAYVNSSIDSGASNKYYCDYVYSNTDRKGFARTGGYCGASSTSTAGCWYIHCRYVQSQIGWSYTATLTYV